MTGRDTAAAAAAAAADTDTLWVPYARRNSLLTALEDCREGGGAGGTQAGVAATAPVLTPRGGIDKRC